MKNSLLVAIDTAKTASKDMPGVIFYVMDKEGVPAIVHSKVWCIKGRLIEGYHTVARYMNGVEI